MKLWAGRTSGEVDKRLNDFNSSLPFDRRMYREDIEGSLAHADMLCRCGIISDADLVAITDGLKGILADINDGKLLIDGDAEDIHMFLEAELTERIGDAGKRLHTARSRNDQVATDLRLYVRAETVALTAKITELVGVLHDMASEHTATIMPGYTHLQRAQPITFAHWLSAYCCMFLRDIDRLCDMRRRMEENPLGSCALAGTTYEIDRQYTSEKLGFLRPCLNSLDGVSDRDYCVEVCSALSLIMVHLSRFSEELILFTSWEYKFLDLDDAFSTGSSIMPQKKNPDIAELVRGKSGRVFGDLTSLLTMLKGLPLAYNKDMQEDKEAVFDALDTVSICLETFIPMIASVKVNKEKMRKAAAEGFLNATDCADYLVKKGMPFRDAYKITGSLVAECIESGHTLEDLPLESYREKSDLFAEDIYEEVSLERCVEGRRSEGGPSAEAVEKTLKIIKTKINP